MKCYNKLQSYGKIIFLHWLSVNNFWESLVSEDLHHDLRLKIIIPGWRRSKNQGRFLWFLGLYEISSESGNAEKGERSSSRAILTSRKLY